MTSATATPNQDALVSEIHIAAPPEHVFQALIDEKKVMQWWTSDECHIKSFSLEPRKGGRWIYDSKSGNHNVNGVNQFHCEGEVLEYAPPRVLSYTWIANWHDRPLERTVVRWELANSKGGTLVRVTHSGLAELPIARKDYSGGWPGVLQALKNYIEAAGKQLFREAHTMENISNAISQDAIEAEVFIAAPPERVFQALIEPQEVLAWWGQAGVYRCTEFNSDLRVGGKWRSAGNGGHNDHFSVTGEYMVVDSPRVLAYSWVASWTGDAKTTVRWELEPADQGTRVRLRHSGLAAHPEIAQAYRGWPRMLGWLKAFLEEGETVEMRKAISA
jgi:uncharacterized protein YndB with AHSA1/START domain